MLLWTWDFTKGNDSVCILFSNILLTCGRYSCFVHLTVLKTPLNFVFQEASRRGHIRGLSLCHWRLWPWTSLRHCGTVWPWKGWVGQCCSYEYPTEWVWGGSVGWLYLRGWRLWWHIISKLSGKVSLALKINTRINKALPNCIILDVVELQTARIFFCKYG